jgi:pimeloyl-ACP methyl ester carboxylesterase
VAVINLAGINIRYELFGRGDRTLVITPGGRYSMDIEGLATLAHALAGQGYRVLLWDRPNCGGSDVCFSGLSESTQNADTLSALLLALALAPAMLVAGSGGAREALMTAIRCPAVVSRLFLFWISGGPIGLSALPYSYCADSAMAAAAEGMEAVAVLPNWQEQIAKNPGNRERLLALDPEWFVRKLMDWGWAFFPKADEFIPGVALSQLAAIDKPTTVLRSGRMDMHHTRETSERLASLIPDAQLLEPPWHEREWPERMTGFSRGESAAKNWPLLLPLLIEAARR